MTGDRQALVFGASGFIGRWLVRELLRQGADVVAAVRSRASFDALASWLADHGEAETPRALLVDFAADDLGLDPSGPLVQDLTEVHNVAGAYRFGMSVCEARDANVLGSERIVRFAAQLPRRPRLVHLSGYRVGGQDPATVPWSQDRIATEYARLGAYEASKVESDAVVQAVAAELDVPWTIVNPATVIGDAETGESEQLVGLADTVRELWAGTLSAVPGNDRTFLPVVTVDTLASMMALVPTDPSVAGQSLWILDDQTPPLPRMLRMLAAHLGVRAPALRAPAWLLRRLPHRLTRADPETLTFLSTDRYPTGPAMRFAERHGLRYPDITRSLQRWADYLVSHRFGELTPRRDQPRSVVCHAGIRTASIGPQDAQTIVLPGLPVNAETWAETAARLNAQVVDLPGLGQSGGSARQSQAWLHDLLGDRRNVHLVGHSVGAGVALEYAAAHPETVARLTLVAPYFAQPRAGALLRVGPMTRAVLRRVSPRRLAQIVSEPGVGSTALESSAQDLRTRSAPAAAQWLSASARREHRTRLQGLLRSYTGKIQIITGGLDPLLDAASLSRDRQPTITQAVIAGAGHHPQLSQPRALADAISAFRSRG